MSEFAYRLSSKRVVSASSFSVPDVPNEPRLSDEELLQQLAARSRISRHVVVTIPDIGILSSLDIGMIAAQLVFIADDRGETLTQEQAERKYRQLMAAAERIRVAISGS